MIVGDPSLFAIESEITTAYERLSIRGIGLFVVYVLGYRYGVHSPNSTALACSFDSVQRRIINRGKHLAPFSQEPDAGKIADAFRYAVYAENADRNVLLSFAQDSLADIFSRNALVWAPDGDEAFDDNSFVLQFDVSDRVRLIAFRSALGCAHEPETLRDAWLPAELYYHTLQLWSDAFEEEWKAMPKVG